MQPQMHGPFPKNPHCIPPQTHKPRRWINTTSSSKWATVPSNLPSSPHLVFSKSPFTTHTHSVRVCVSMMSASPEFYKPAPVFSPCSSPLRLLQQQHGEDHQEEYGYGSSGGCCRTPTGGESNLKAPGTCPPAPRKPRAPAAPCRKRLFEVEVLSLRLEELERLFWRPPPPPPTTQPQPQKPPQKRRRVAKLGS